MKKNVLIVVALLFVLSIALSADDVALGAMFGEPTGVSLKIGRFPVLGVAWSFANQLHIHCDYWLLNPPIVEQLNWYVGLGGKVAIYTPASSKSNDLFGITVRFPAGLQYFPVEKLEIFGEIALGLALFPQTTLDPAGGIGLRWHF